MTNPNGPQNNPPISIQQFLATPWPWPASVFINPRNIASQVNQAYSYIPVQPPQSSIVPLQRTPIDDAEDDPDLYVGLEMRGYRSWCGGWDGDIPVLRPVYRARQIAWQPGDNNHAVCSANAFDPDNVPQPHPGHTIPNRRCECGFWAFTDPDAISYDSTRNLMLSPYASSLVTGVVRARGRTQPFDFGFRSERAEIVALAPSRTYDHLLDLLDNDDFTSGYQGAFLRTQIVHGHHGVCPCLWCTHERGRAAPTLEVLAERYGVPHYPTYDAMVDAWQPTHANSSFAVDPDSRTAYRHTAEDESHNIAALSARIQRWVEPSRDAPATTTVADLIKKFWEWNLKTRP